MELKKFREKLGLSQTEVANRLEINSQTYNRYETGVNQPNIEMLIKLANFFNISLDDLVGRESNTINLNYYDNDKKELICYLVKEDNKTIQRVFDFYKGMKYDLLNGAMGFQKPQQLFDNNYNSAKSLFEKPKSLFEPQGNDLIKQVEQNRFLANIENDPFFKKQREKDNK